MKIQMGVFATNASGEPDIFLTAVECTEEQYSQGDHYDFAKAKAVTRGLNPVMAFDERDPAWGAMTAANSVPKVPSISSLSVAQMAKTVWGNPIPKEAYEFANLLQAEMARLGSNVEAAPVHKAFFEAALVKLQGAFVGDHDCNGGDLVSDVAQLFLDHLAEEGIATQPVFMCLTDDGFFSGATLDYEVAPAVFLDAERALQLATAGWPVVSFPVSTLANPLPDADDLENAADSALSRSKRYGFSIGPENASEVMREELALAGFGENVIPPEFNAILDFVMSREIESQREELAERG